MDQIKNIAIWGNHSATQYPDTHHATVAGESLRARLNDDAYLNEEFIQTVQKRGQAIIAAMGKSSVASAANAICDHMHDWWFGNQAGGWVSMGVICEAGAYGIDADLCFSFPCNVNSSGDWAIVEGLEINEFSRGKLDATMAEL